MLSISELFFIFMIIFFIFGPQKSSEIINTIKSLIAEFKKAQKITEISNNFDVSIFDDNNNKILLNNKNNYNNLNSNYHCLDSNLIKISKKLDIELKDNINSNEELLKLILNKIK